MRTVEPELVRRALVSHVGLARRERGHGKHAITRVLARLRCIQLDPLDVIGTNPDLVVMARVRGAKRGDVFRALLPTHGFEHFAKERCLLPAAAFPYYRTQAVEAPWWRTSERMKRIDENVLARVLEQVRTRGPIAAEDLEDHGRVEPLDWSGWKGTSSAAKMALEVLWTRCEVVVAGRTARGKLYDVPERALPKHATSQPTMAFARWAIVERAEACGLLCRNQGPQWSMLSSVRTSPLVDELVREGALEDVMVRGSPRRYLAPAGFFERKVDEPDDELRILGPLDPLLWDRKLVELAFGFEYVWEVYKPASERRYGWYVCPLLHRGHLVGRIEARIEDDALVVVRVWPEAGRRLDARALDATLERHASGCGATRVVWRRQRARTVREKKRRRAASAR